ncbi:MAG: NAD(P)H-binding protein [Planctomycetota bacterium]
MRLLVAGCGWLGREIARRARDAGDEVVALSRRPRELPRGVVALAADLTRPETLGELPTGLDAVVYAAAADGRDEPSYRAAYPIGLGHLLAALGARAEARPRVLFCSSTGVWGEADGGWVDETTPADADHFTGRVIREAEAALAASVFPGIALRLGGLYGPGRERLIDAVRAGRPLGDDAAWTNRIHRDDAAAAVLHLLRLERPAALYAGVDGHPARMGEVRAFLAAELGLALPPAAAPGGAAANGNHRRGEGKRVRGERLRATGFRPSFPDFRAGYRSLLAARGEGEGEKD